MACRLSSVEPPEIAADRFYSTKAPSDKQEPPAQARADSEEDWEACLDPVAPVQTKPLGVLQALGLDRAGGSSCPHHYRKSYLKDRLSGCDGMYSSDIVGHHGCVNALAFSKGDEQFLGTGVCVCGQAKWTMSYTLPLPFPSLLIPLLPSLPPSLPPSFPHQQWEG